jgi:radical SAM protein with 4Fe4S-binding SPASM domain
MFGALAVHPGGFAVNRATLNPFSNRPGYFRADGVKRSAHLARGFSPESVLAEIKGSAFLRYREKWQAAGDFIMTPQWPLHLDVDTNYTCNLSCVMCPLGAGGFPVSYPKKFLDFSLYKKVLTEGADQGLASIRLGITGEPLLRPDILDFVRLARDLGLLDIMLITNGLLLTREMSAELIESGLTRLMVSLDAARSRTYDRIRKGGDFGRVMENVLDFLALRSQAGSDLPLLRVSFVRMSLNEEDDEDFRRFWEERADYMAFQEYANIMEREETDFFRQDRPRVLEFRCPDPFQRMGLFVNGDLFPCCSDFGRLAPMGNAKHDTISQVWQSKAAVRLRQLHKNGGFASDPICRRCALSSTGTENK